MAALLGRGQFFEYWQAQLRPGAAAQAVDGYVLDKRHEHAVPLVRADVVNHEGGRAVVLARKLRPASALRKDIVPGKTYHVGFAVHDDDMGHRFHYVSLEYSFRLDAGPADFVVIGK